MTVTTYMTDFLVATGVGLTFFSLGWLATRAIFLGKSPPRHLKTALVYGFLFILGMTYIMMIVSWLNWAPRTIVAAVLIWGALLAYIGWRRVGDRARQKHDQIEP